MVRVENVYKEGSMLIIKLDEKDTPYKFNCATYQLYSWSGRPVKTPGLLSNTYSSQTAHRIVIKALVLGIKEGYWNDFKKIELFLNNLDLLSADFISGVPEECPKGYINWLKENNLKINVRTLEEFHRRELFKNLTKEQNDFLDFLTTAFSENSDYITAFLKMNTLQKTRVIQITKLSAKQLRWNLKDGFKKFMEHIGKGFYNYCGIDDWENYVDPNRDFEHNAQILDDITNKERNEKILAFENLFRAIEKLSNDKYTIVVPKEMWDFTDEGKRQNNCVGSYYHDDMANHYDFIYFIRKTAKPKKSYITNRFNFYCNETCESRIVNNNDVNDTNAEKLIEEIDKEIRNICAELSQKGIVLGDC